MEFTTRSSSDEASKVDGRNNWRKQRKVENENGSQKKGSRYIGDTQGARMQNMEWPVAERLPNLVERRPHVARRGALQQRTKKKNQEEEIEQAAMWATEAHEEEEKELLQDLRL